ncbi:MAG: hypothetical protein IJR18_08325, partial [Campylobacter sp.]|nr:hypothetical protein [Campylobacter sp.]
GEGGCQPPFPLKKKLSDSLNLHNLKFANSRSGYFSFCSATLRFARNLPRTLCVSSLRLFWRLPHSLRSFAMTME